MPDQGNQAMLRQAEPARASVECQDLLDAAGDGLITRSQAEQLWSCWEGSGPARAAAAGRGAAFNFGNALYYFGGLIAIGSMSFFRLCSR